MSTVKPAATKRVAKPKAANAVAVAKAAPVPQVNVAIPSATTKQAPSTTGKAVVKVARVSTAKPASTKKPKMVRDSLTMPKAEYAFLDLLKVRATKLQTHVKKTELIRAGIKALAAMPDSAFLAAVAAVPNLKTGRPKKD